MHWTVIMIKSIMQLADSGKAMKNALTTPQILGPP